MREVEIEAWTLRVLDGARAGGPGRDDRVELLSQWGDPHSLARSLAGLANASRGEPALWLVGVDQTGTVYGADEADFPDWWRAMSAQFDGLAPDVHHVVVPYQGSTVVAIQIDTTRGPFVVKNPEFGRAGQLISHEVPWRDGTALRSARREDLLRLLVARSRLPAVEFGTAELRATDRMGQAAGRAAGRAAVAGEHERYEWSLRIGVYLENVTAPLFIPDHRCRCELHAVPVGGWAEELKLEGHPPRHTQRPSWGATGSDLASTAERGVGQLIVTGPGPISFHGTGVSGVAPLSDLDCCLSFGVVDADALAVVDFTLVAEPSTTGHVRRWSANRRAT
jgi:hypothetical protein